MKILGTVTSVDKINWDITPYLWCQDKFDKGYYITLLTTNGAFRITKKYSDARLRLWHDLTNIQLERKSEFISTTL